MKIYKIALSLLVIFILSGCSNNIQNESKNESAKKTIYPFQEKDGKIYYGNSELIEAEPESFQTYEKIKCHDEELGTVSCFAHDANAVFYHSAKIEGAKPDGFVFLENGYKKDTDSVFYIMDNNLDWNVAGADAYSFYVLGHSKYFFQSERCTNLIDKTNICSEESSYAYAKDKNHAYYDGRVIPEADGPSFVLIIGSEKYDAMDKNSKYKNGVVIE